MDDEIHIVGKLFDFGVVAVLSAVFDRKGMKLKNVEEDALVGFCRLGHVDPDY
jgi:hypothetical protein